jgi:hypothetical protein
VINFLVVVQTFVNILLVGLAGPKDIPVMSLCQLEGIGLQHRPNQLGFTLYQLVEHVAGVFAADLLIQDSAFLEIDGGLAIVHQLIKLLNGKLTYN